MDLPCEGSFSSKRARKHGTIVFLSPARGRLSMSAFAAVRRLRDSESARDFISGGCAEAVSRVVLHPLDTLKLQRQMHAATLTAPRTFLSMFYGLRESFVGAVPTTAAFATMYNIFKNQFVQMVPEEYEGVVSVGAATLATFIASCVEEPLELIKQRLQAGVSASFHEAVRDATQERGVLGLYRGLRSSLVKDLPFDALEFATYEQLRKLYRRVRRRTDQLSETELLCLGMATGGIVGTVTLPADVVRTRIITNSAKYPGIRKTVATIVEEEGVRSLFRGFRHRVVIESIDSGIFFLMYDTLQRVLKGNNGGAEPPPPRPR